MAATSIFFQGRTISTPMVVSKVDASALAGGGLGASGIVALIGEAVGSAPASEFTMPKDFLSATRQEKILSLFRSGPLREAGLMLFGASKDEQITGRPQKVYFMKTNQATQSSTTLVDDDGIACCTVDSADYGLHTEQVNISIAADEPRGKLVTVVFESDSVAQSNVGGYDETPADCDPMFTLKYVDPTGAGQATGWKTMTAQVTSSGIRCNGGRTELGQADQLTGQMLGNGTVTYTRGHADNNGKTITVYGLDAGGDPASETRTLGASPVVGTQVFSKVYGGTMSAAAASGAATVTETAGGTTKLSFGAGVRDRGMVRCAAMFVAKSKVAFGYTANATAAADLIVIGKSSSGAAVLEKVAIADPGADPIVRVETTNTLSELTGVVLGHAAIADTVEITAPAASTTHAAYNSLTKVRDYFDGRQVDSGTPAAPWGFIFTMVTGRTSFDPAKLDLNPTVVDIDGLDSGFYADLDAFVSAVTATKTKYAVATRTAFRAKVFTVTVTAGNGTTYTVTIDGTDCQFLSDGSGTLAEIQAGIIAAINLDPTARTKVVATASSTDKVVVTVTVAKDINVTVAAAGGAGTIAIATTTTLLGTGRPPADVTNRYLSGGIEGTTSFSDVQACLNQLKQLRVNTIVVLSQDPAVHAALDAHCAYMGGIGRSERDGFVGLSALSGGSPTGELPTKSEVISQIVDINSRHIRAFAQNVERYDSTGARTTFGPQYLATIAAGMQAGASVGTSLTRKYANVLSVTQDVSWNPVDDGEDMINAGLCFLEEIDGFGRRFVRNVTTYLQETNIAFQEGSVNQAVNYATYEFRASMEFAVGQKGFAGTIGAAEARAVTKLGALMKEGVITNWDALEFDLAVDVLETSLQMAPVIPINFIPITFHLVTNPQRLAA